MKFDLFIVKSKYYASKKLYNQVPWDLLFKNLKSTSKPKKDVVRLWNLVKSQVFYKKNVYQAHIHAITCMRVTWYLAHKFNRASIRADAPCNGSRSRHSQSSEAGLFWFQNPYQKLVTVKLCQFCSYFYNLRDVLRTYNFWIRIPLDL